MVQLLRLRLTTVEWSIFVLLCFGVSSCQEHDALPPPTKLEQELNLTKGNRRILINFRKASFPRDREIYYGTYEILQGIRGKNLSGDLRYLSEGEIVELCGPFDIRREKNRYPAYSLKDPDIAKVTATLRIVIENNKFKGVRQGASILDPQALLKEMKEKE